MSQGIIQESKNTVYINETSFENRLYTLHTYVTLLVVFLVKNPVNVIKSRVWVMINGKGQVFNCFAISTFTFFSCVWVFFSCRHVSTMCTNCPQRPEEVGQIH